MAMERVGPWVESGDEGRTGWDPRSADVKRQGYQMNLIPGLTGTKMNPARRVAGSPLLLTRCILWDLESHLIEGGWLHLPCLCLNCCLYMRIAV